MLYFFPLWKSHRTICDAILEIATPQGSLAGGLLLHPRKRARQTSHGARRLREPRFKEAQPASEENPAPFTNPTHLCEEVTHGCTNSKRVESREGAASSMGGKRTILASGEAKELEVLTPFLLLLPSRGLPLPSSSLPHRPSDPQYVHSDASGGFCSTRLFGSTPQREAAAEGNPVAHGFLPPTHPLLALNG